MQIYHICPRSVVKCVNGYKQKKNANEYFKWDNFLSINGRSNITLLDKCITEKEKRSNDSVHTNTISKTPTNTNDTSFLQHPNYYPNLAPNDVLIFQIAKWLNIFRIYV